MGTRKLIIAVESAGSKAEVAPCAWKFDGTKWAQSHQIHLLPSRAIYHSAYRGERTPLKSMYKAIYKSYDLNLKLLEAHLVGELPHPSKSESELRNTSTMNA